MTREDLIRIALDVTGMGLDRWNALREIMKDDAAMNRVMKSQWEERPRCDEPAILDYYRKSDIWFVNTWNGGYGGLLHMANREMHSPNEWQRRFLSLVPSPGHGSLLDYGAGFLRDSWNLVTLGYRVDVAEVKGPVTEFLWRYLKESGLEDRFGIIEVESDLSIHGDYRGILCFETLEHVFDPIALTRNLHKCLVPGGPFAFSVSFGNSSHAPYHVASNAWLGDPAVWSGKLLEIGFAPCWDGGNTNPKIWRRLS